MKVLCVNIVFILLAVMLLCCRSGGSSDLGGGRVDELSDTLYTKKAAMEAFASDPDRALLIIDSAEIVGNLSDVAADLLRAKVYSWACEEMNYDTAILIGERLMQHKTVVENVDLQEDVLEILLNACRLRKDYEQALHWASELEDIYLSRGETTEALRNDAEIGTLLIHIGQQEEGFAKVDSVVGQLEGKRKFNEMDAMIFALKRKAEICIEKKRFADVIPVNLGKRKLAEKNAAMVKLIDEREAINQWQNGCEENGGGDLALFYQLERRIRAERIYAEQGGNVMKSPR